MTSKKRKASRRATTKSGRKAKQTKTVKPRSTLKKLELKRPSTLPLQVIQSLTRVEPQIMERPKITVGTIRGDTVIGDLLVTFPRARDVLVREGLRLEADDAGDIYMTLDVFSAMNGLKAEKLVLDIVELVSEPVPQSPVSQLATTPAP